MAFHRSPSRLDGQLDGAFVVRADVYLTCRASIPMLSPDRSARRLRHRLMQTSTLATRLPPIRSLLGSKTGVARRHHRDGVQLLHVGDGEGVPDAGLVRREVGHEQVLAE